MEFAEFFEDFDKGILKLEFKRERRAEFQKWISENTFTGKTKIYGPGELVREINERKIAKLEAEKLARNGDEANKPGTEFPL